MIDAGTAKFSPSFALARKDIICAKMLDGLATLGSMPQCPDPTKRILAALRKLTHDTARRVLQLNVSMKWKNKFQQRKASECLKPFIYGQGSQTQFSPSTFIFRFVGKHFELFC